MSFYYTFERYHSIQSVISSKPKFFQTRRLRRRVRALCARKSCNLIPSQVRTLQSTNILLTEKEKVNGMWLVTLFPNPMLYLVQMAYRCAISPYSAYGIFNSSTLNSDHTPPRFFFETLHCLIFAILIIFIFAHPDITRFRSYL